MTRKNGAGFSTPDEERRAAQARCNAVAARGIMATGDAAVIEAYQREIRNMGRGNTTSQQMAAAARIQEQVGAVRSGQGQYVQGQFVTNAQLDDLTEMGVRPAKKGEQPTQMVYLEDGRTGIAVTSIKSPRP